MPEKLTHIGAASAIALGLYLSSLYSYLLFHSLIEIVTIAIALALFILTWNTRAYSETAVSGCSGSAMRSAPSSTWCTPLRTRG